MPLRPFHPAVQRWFLNELGQPTAAQAETWPRIRAGDNVLLAAPTGSGKTLAAFLCALDQLLQRGDDLPDETAVLYVSPLKALANDVQKNLHHPLGEIRGLDPGLPEVRVLVRSGDTTASERARMIRKPPHILVTTPESLYILLTSEGGRAMLGSVRKVIVDEIHAVLASKRGSHLALSLERLEALTNSTGTELQRIGLSATQRPIEDVSRFLVGVGRPCELVDRGHRRNLDLRIEIPSSDLSPICAHEVWDDIYRRMLELIDAHRTTLIFANTRKLTERIAAHLTKELGKDKVTSHHSSLSKERRLDAEQRLKAGQLRALVATASLELGIDIGDVDLVIQAGVTHSIATLLQRVGRSGHGVHRLPKGRLFPLTTDELVCAAALVRAVHDKQLDRTPQPGKPLDILAQQVVAACVAETWSEDELFTCFTRAYPYRDLPRADFDQVLALHTDGRRALLHRDSVGGKVRATKRARIPAITGGGAIPDRADYRVMLEPEGTFIGTVDEDFAIESSAGDIFQLGNASWQVLKLEQGTMRVADAKGAPPNLPFWFGEAPSRTKELCAALSEVREQGHDEGWLQQQPGLPAGAARQIADYLDAGRKALGTIPTHRRIVAERFFDESGGMQLVLHMPMGSRVNRAFGLALRKRFCRGFGFELQAAANEEGIVISLGPMHSFKLADVFEYLHPDTVRDLLVQAVLPQPMFQTRWRWNVTRSLVVPRFGGGKPVPAPLLRMRADDALAAAFPQALACFETLPPGDIEVPMDHPLVRQTVVDCLEEAMDIDALVEVLRNMRNGAIECVAVDVSEPSPLALGVMSTGNYGFLDDAPLEERRTQAVLSRRGLDDKTADDLGELCPEAVARVREEAWPQPENIEEVHEVLLWMGYVQNREAETHGWLSWLRELESAGRVVAEHDRWFAVEASRDPKAMLRGRMEALGPITAGGEHDDPLLPTLEAEGVVLRTRLRGSEAWCDRRLLARIHRYTVERLRQEIEPVPTAAYLRFLSCWQHVDPKHQLEGPHGVNQVIAKLAGFPIPAAAWEIHVLRARIKDYRQEFLDQLTLHGEVTWGRLWDIDPSQRNTSAIRTTPICLFPRQDMDTWLTLRGALPDPSPTLGIPTLGGNAAMLFELLQQRGSMFPQELQKLTNLIPTHLEQGLEELIARGLLHCDSFAGLRQFFTAPSRRQAPVVPVGRWSLIDRNAAAGEDSIDPEFLARQLLHRYGVVFRKVLLREKLPLPWRDLLRVYRHLELRGEIRGGRFVQRFAGEQFALPEAIPLLRQVRREQSRPALRVAAADPLNLRGILTPDERVSPLTRTWVEVG
ncbi:MAG: DEAD/DEAH box helicase [Planctomycetota bacterium]|jgi:ATP-dependent Lhr-like helicase